VDVNHLSGKDRQVDRDIEPRRGLVDALVQDDEPAGELADEAGRLLRANLLSILSESFSLLIVTHRFAHFKSGIPCAEKWSGHAARMSRDCLAKLAMACSGGRSA
jgi:hypothetical protein